MPTYTGTNGNDAITGSSGTDTIYGFAGDDLLIGGDGADTIDGGDDNDVLMDYDGFNPDLYADTLNGGGGNDTIYAGFGDSVNGGFGSDALIYRMDNATGSIVIDWTDLWNGISYNINGAILTSIERIHWIVGGQYDDLMVLGTPNGFTAELAGGGGADLLIGGNGNDYLNADFFYDGAVRNDVYYDELFGLAGNDNLFGGLGDLLDGGDGIDTASIDAGASGAGVTLDFNAMLSLHAGNVGGTDFYSIEHVGRIYGSLYDDVIHIGVEQNDARLYGRDGDDVINGGQGNDLIDGGSGADEMRGSGGNDTYFVDNAADEVYEAATYGNDIVCTTVSYALLSGQSIETLSTANAAGTAAIDLTGNALGQLVYGNAGANTLTGGGGADTLVGFGGDDRLYGNADAASTLQGGTGDDFYYLSIAGDSLIESAGEGFDRVYASVSYVLSAGREIEFLSTLNQAATVALDLTGNAYSQAILGNEGANNLTGGGGADYLVGYGGADILFGNADAASTLQGGTGDDWYYVQRTGDSLVEFAGEGSDRILTSVSYSLSAGQEIETLAVADQAGGGAIDLAGNDYAQLILGNDGTNTISGGGGNDVLAGLGGDDILLGGDGADQLNGGGGYDILNGGSGADIFVFANALGGTNVDGIQDFVSGVDRIFLENDVFVGLATGALAAGAFAFGTVAQDADDRILYDASSGALYFDADGVGGTAAVQFALLSGAPALAASDFIVI